MKCVVRFAADTALTLPPLARRVPPSSAGRREAELVRSSLLKAGEGARVAENPKKAQLPEVGCYAFDVLPWTGGVS